jgi:hypothetical protein
LAVPKLKSAKLKILLVIFLVLNLAVGNAQTVDTLAAKQNSPAADDPSQFITRVEFFNELQHYDKKDFDLNQTTIRAVVKIGKQFSTRLDVPFVYNTVPTATGLRNTGLGDISFRLLGYKFKEKPKSAITASIEVSLNTAQSPILGTGKYVLLPVVSFSRIIPKERMIVGVILQQANAVAGDKDRANISFTKMQVVALKAWSKRIWSYMAPEMYVDYVQGGVSMNLKGRTAYAITPRMNIWATAGAGLFGEFPGRYQWSAEIGYRYFFLRKMNFKKN